MNWRRWQLRSEEPAIQQSFASLDRDIQSWPEAKGTRPWTGRRRRWVPGLLEEFQKRALERGLRSSTAASQMRAVRSTLKAAARQLGQPVDIRDLLLDPAMLARAACDPVRLDGRGQQELTTDTLRSRRISMRSCIRLLEDILGVDADEHVRSFEDELRKIFPLVGQSYLPLAGRGRRDRPEKSTPTLRDIEALWRHLARPRGGYVAERNLLFFELLLSTGLRLSSLIAINTADFHLTGFGWSVFVREKNQREDPDQPVSPEAMHALKRYFAAYERDAAECGAFDRLSFDSPSPLWRHGANGVWKRQAAYLMLRTASQRSCGKAFGPHAIRRFVARHGLENFSRPTVATAIGWSSLKTLDEHYGPAPGRSLAHRPQVEEGRNPNEHDSNDWQARRQKTTRSYAEVVA